jgi:dihydroneopterin aldolase
MIIEIENLTFQAIIGILDFEREEPQDVIINLSIEYNFNDKFINYAEVSHLIKKRVIKKRFLLIEDALADLSKKLKKEFSQISSLKLKITKPSILPDCMVSVSEKYIFNS